MNHHTKRPVFANTEQIIVLSLCVFYFIMAVFGRGAFWESFEKTDLYFTIFTFPVVFIINAYFLLPFFVKKNKWLLYFLSLAALQLGFESLRFLLKKSGPKVLFDNPNTMILFAFGVFVSWVFVSMRDWLMNIRIIEKLKSEKLRSELDFLKVQVDPHFLFNTLNSIYALALEEKSEKTADSIVKLSALMRYNLHDSNEQTISVEKEIGYIEKYIDLQKLRLNENNKIEVEIDFERRRNHAAKIAPLLLIPFIENTFKYGAAPSKSTLTLIKILVTDNFIILQTVNDITEAPAVSPKSGVGLKNVKNRLDLLYADKYELSYRIESNRHHSYLKIMF